MHGKRCIELSFVCVLSKISYCKISAYLNVDLLIEVNYKVTVFVLLIIKFVFLRKIKRCAQLRNHTDSQYSCAILDCAIFKIFFLNMCTILGNDRAIFFFAIKKMWYKKVKKYFCTWNICLILRHICLMHP